MPYPNGVGKYSHTQKSTPIFAAGRPKPIGQVTGNVFTKAVAASKHFLIRPRAIAFDLQSLAEAQDAGATLVQITDIETQNIYSAAVSLVYDCGFCFNRRFGNQIALDLVYWSINGQPPEHKRNEIIRTTKQQQAGQLALFGGA